MVGNRHLARPGGVLELYMGCCRARQLIPAIIMQLFQNFVDPHSVHLSVLRVYSYFMRMSRIHAMTGSVDAYWLTLKRMPGHGRGPFLVVSQIIGGRALAGRNWGGQGGQGEMPNDYVLILSIYTAIIIRHLSWGERLSSPSLTANMISERGSRCFTGKQSDI